MLAPAPQAIGADSHNTDYGNFFDADTNCRGGFRWSRLRCTERAVSGAARTSRGTPEVNVQKGNSLALTGPPNGRGAAAVIEGIAARAAGDEAH